MDILGDEPLASFVPDGHDRIQKVNKSVCMATGEEEKINPILHRLHTGHVLVGPVLQDELFQV